MFKKSKQQVDCSRIRFLFETVLVILVFVIRVCFACPAVGEFRASIFEFTFN
jgi:hypothetical protein